MRTQKRKNAVYTGQSTWVSTGGTGDRDLVDHFYKVLNELLRPYPDEEIEIIPPEQVNPTHSSRYQMLRIADYCVRKILPEVTGLCDWGAEVTQRLRALKPIVDGETAKSAYSAVYAAVKSASTAYSAVPADTAAAFAAARAASGAAEAAISIYAAPTGYDGAVCVFYALIATIENDDEAAYNRIIDLTNEMLESL